MAHLTTEATSPRAYHRARAIIIARSLGTRAAAGYLRNLGYRIEYALAILATTGHHEPCCMMPMFRCGLAYTALTPS
jgi:hypothetical protein